MEREKKGTENKYKIKDKDSYLLLFSVKNVSYTTYTTSDRIFVFALKCACLK